MSVLDSYFFCLNKPRYINISEFIRIKNLAEIKEVEKMFSNKSWSEINKGIIIPMKYSHKIIFTIKSTIINLIKIKNKKWKQNNELVWLFFHFIFINHRWLRNDYHIRRCLVYLLSSPPVNLEKSWSLNFFNKNFYVKNLSLRTYFELNLLFFCFFYLITMQ